MIGGNNMIGENFTGVHNGTVYSNGVPIGEIGTKYSDYTKRGSTKGETKNKEDLLNILKEKKK
jgi:hypothetical protein